MHRPSWSKIVSSAVLAFAAQFAVAQTSGAPISGRGTWETTLQARDINSDGIVDAYYDTDLNITWLAEADVIGWVTWSEAVNWASNLNVYGVTGWELPSSTITAYGGNGWCDYGLGGHDCGFRPETVTPMAHLYYVTLGNLGYYYDPSQGGYVVDGTGVENTGPFRNFTERAYWSSSLTPDPTRAWDFNFLGGALNNISVDHPLLAWATHQGDIGAIAAPVPEPATYALLLAGMGAVMMRRRRKS